MKQQTSYSSVHFPKNSIKGCSLRCTWMDDIKSTPTQGKLGHLTGKMISQQLRKTGNSERWLLESEED